MAVFGRADAIMIVDHNETKAFRIIFFPEMHVEQVEIVAINQCLVIGILKLWLSGAVVWSGQNGQRRLGHAIRHLTNKESVYKIKANYLGVD